MHRVKFLPNAPLAFKPRYVDNMWRKPRFSAMQMAKLRKHALLAGEDYPWNPPLREIRPVIMKGHKWEAAKRERARTIEKNMKEMPERIIEHRRQRRERKKKPYDIAWWIQNTL